MTSASFFVSNAASMTLEDSVPDVCRSDPWMTLFNTDFGIDLSIRTINGIEKPNPYKHSVIRTVGDLLDSTSEDLLERRGFGSKCLAEVEAALDKHGLKLRKVGEVTHWVWEKYLSSLGNDLCGCEVRAICRRLESIVRQKIDPESETYQLAVAMLDAAKVHAKKSMEAVA